MIRALDKPHLVCALAYAAIGMVMGVAMAASHDHAQFITHAHVLLVGFVTSLLYAIVCRLWLSGAPRTLATCQFVAHQSGALTMMIGLGLLYGMPDRARWVEPVLAAGSVAVLAGALLMLVLVIGRKAMPASSEVR